MSHSGIDKATILVQHFTFDFVASVQLSRSMLLFLPANIMRNFAESANFGLINDSTRVLITSFQPLLTSTLPTMTHIDSANQEVQYRPAER